MYLAMVSDLILQQFKSAATENSLPLKWQVYTALRQAILDNRLPQGTRLPATRSLADELNVGRNTVLHAYEQLLAEGYVEGKIGAGTYVANILHDEKLRGKPRVPSPSIFERPTLSNRGSRITSHISASPIQHGAFMPGIPDVDLFPHKLWRKLISRHIGTRHTSLMQYATGGYGPLKAVLAEYLRLARFIECDPNQVIIVNGTHQAVDLCARLLTDIGDTAWTEEPGYWGARTVFRANSLNVRPVEVDHSGLAPQEDDWADPPRLIFVSPSCQYPTGAVLSLPRRLALLKRSNSCGAWIIEDDYDNELRYHKQPIASLYALAETENVIYLGTFSKIMFPGLRLSYLVVPPSLVEAFNIGNSELYREGHLVEQAAITDFFSGGHLASHIRHMRVIYKERQAVLRKHLEGQLGDRVVLCGGKSGIHLMYRFFDSVDDEKLAQEALEEGIIIRPLSLYYQNPDGRQPGMVLGYADVPVEKIKPAIDCLVGIINRHCRKEN